MQQRNETLRSYIQRWSIIKNSAVNVSNERAIDAFTVGLPSGPSQRNGTNQAKNSVRINGYIKQICGQ
jgi:hypothetical protein